MIDTKQKILDTAERLFGDHGYGATSLRQVITDAEVNVAAVHYHFGCKEELLDAVVSRKAGPLTLERLTRLDAVEAEAGPNPPPLEGILAAFLMPPAELAQRDPAFVRLMGRILGEGLMRLMVERYFRGTSERFLGALGRALPHLSHEELLWRFYFMIGAMAHTLRADSLVCGPEPDHLRRTRRLIAFLCGAFRAPAECKEN